MFKKNQNAKIRQKIRWNTLIQQKALYKLCNLLYKFYFYKKWKILLNDKSKIYKYEQKNIITVSFISKERKNFLESFRKCLDKQV